MSTKKPTRYRVKIGIDYGTKRAEPGTIVDDLPTSSVAWLLEQGVIEPDTAPAPAEDQV